MRWRNRWPERAPRPKAAKLTKEELQRLHARAVRFVERSPILGELVEEVKLSRGRLYLWREPEDLMARFTPLDECMMLLESPRGSSWTEHKRGRLETVLRHMEHDRQGTFHGLGSLLAKDRDTNPSAQVILHRDLGIPLRVLAEPGYWYAMHRTPVIAEINEDKDRALVRFVAQGLRGSFHGTCLYARRAGEWGCYTIRPNASESITTAEAWLNKRGWKEWD